MKKDWWKSFYDQEMGDELFASDRFLEAVAEIDLIVRRAQLKPGMRILDLACGFGRHSLELARRGYEVTGLDYSRAYVKKASRLARELKLTKRQVSFVQGDMRAASKVLKGQKFDAVISLWNSFGYFDKRSDDARVIQEISRLLKPQGQLILNSLNLSGTQFRLKTIPSYLGKDSLTQGGMDRDDRYWLTDSFYDAKRRKVHALWHFIDLKKGRARLEEFSQNVYSPSDYRGMLARHEMKMTRLWGKLTGAKYSKRSWHLTFIARKN